MTLKRHGKFESATDMMLGFASFALFACAIFIADAESAAAQDAIRSDKSEESVETDACRAFGPGYVRLGSTSTCIKIGGSVRVDIGGGDTSRRERADD